VRFDRAIKSGMPDAKGTRSEEMIAMKALSSSKNHADTTGTPRIEWMPIGVLRPNPRNARTHSPKQVRQIAASIRKFGFLNPVLVDDANMVLAGHGRLEAARLEGLDQVPVVRFGHLTGVQKRAYLVADNKIAEQAGWDRQMLAIELGELIDLLPTEGFDVSLTGFEAPEIDLLLADMAPSKPKPEDILPALPPNPATCRGDLWQLKKHRLLCGDAPRVRQPRIMACERPLPATGRDAVRHRRSLRGGCHCAICKRSAPANPGCNIGDREW
jgi:hypothetical protein